MSVIVLIPARKGSKRLKDKNIKMLGRQPLIEHTIQYAVDQIAPKNVYVYTDIDTKLFAHHGAKIIERSDDVHDACSADEVILNFISKVHKLKAQNLFLLQATSPFREMNLLEKMIEKKENTGAEVVASGTIFDHDLWFDSGKFAVNCFNEPRRQQERSRKVYENGLAYLIDVRAFKYSKQLRQLTWSFFETDPLFSLDINNEIDFMLAEMLLPAWKKRSR